MVFYLFLLVASADVALSITFAVLITKVPKGRLTKAHFDLARSQRKDNWLGVPLLWAGVLNGGLPLHSLVLVLASLILGWLTRRTLYRVLALRRATADKFST